MANSESLMGHHPNTGVTAERTTEVLSGLDYNPQRHYVSRKDFDPSRFLGSLTPQQVRIMQLIADGCNNLGELADELFLARKTVKNYLSVIYSELGTSNKTEALLRCIQLNLVKGYCVVEGAVEPSSELPGGPEPTISSLLEGVSHALEGLAAAEDEKGINELVNELGALADRASNMIAVRRATTTPTTQEMPSREELLNSSTHQAHGGGRKVVVEQRSQVARPEASSAVVDKGAVDSVSDEGSNRAVSAKTGVISERADMSPRARDRLKRARERADSKEAAERATKTGGASFFTQDPGRTVR